MVCVMLPSTETPETHTPDTETDITNIFLFFASDIYFFDKLFTFLYITFILTFIFVSMDAIVLSSDVAEKHDIRPSMYLVILEGCRRCF